MSKNNDHGVIDEIKRDPEKAIATMLAECKIPFSEISSVIVTDRSGHLYISGLITQDRPLDIFRLYMDVVAGDPTTDQVIDSVYGRGKGFNKRFIISAGDFRLGDGFASNEEYTIQGFVEGMNAYGVNLHFCKAALIDNSFKVEWIHEGAQPLSDHELPSELQVRECEFWDIYFYADENDHHPGDLMEDGLHEPTREGWWQEAEKVDLRGYWDHWGVRLEVTSADQVNYVDLIWDSNRDRIEGMFKGCEIDYETHPFNQSKITIQLSNIPIERLLSVDASWRVSFAEKLHAQFSQAHTVFEDSCLLLELKEGELEQIQSSQNPKEFQHGALKGNGEGGACILE